MPIIETTFGVCFLDPAQCLYMLQEEIFIIASLTRHLKIISDYSLPGK